MAEPDDAGQEPRWLELFARGADDSGEGLITIRDIAAALIGNPIWKFWWD